MINSRVELLFKDLPDQYPHHLERDYIRILNRLMQVWDLPEFDSYMHELTVDKRSGRQGFPPEVVAELMFLGELHDIFMHKGYRLPVIPDSWKGIPVPNPTPQGFHQAIEHGQLEVIETFLGAGVKADYRFDGAQTPLMVAVNNGQLGAVRCLIEDGAGVNLRDAGEYTALHWAAFYGHSQIVRVLIDADAEINAKQNKGDTPLALAVKRGHLAVAKLLRECQAGPNIASNHGLPLITSLVKKKPKNESKDTNPNKSAKGEDPSCQDDKPHFSHIPLDILILMAIFVLVAFGLGVYIGYQQHAAITPNPSHAVTPNSAVPDIAIAALPKPPDTELQQANQSDKPPKIKASRHKEKIKQTVVNKEVAYTFNDLINAVWHSDANGVDRILAQGVEINRRDSSGLTPLIVAVENNDLNMVKHLIDKGADPNMPRQRDGYSPIVVAKTASKPNVELIEFLEASGARNPFK